MYVVYQPWMPQTPTRTSNLALLRSPTHSLGLAASATIWSSWWPTQRYLQDGWWHWPNGSDVHRVRKTGYFTMHMLLLIALSKDPSIVAPFKLKRKVPANPAMAIVFWQEQWLEENSMWRHCDFLHITQAAHFYGVHQPTSFSVSVQYSLDFLCFGSIYTWCWCLISWLISADKGVRVE